MQVQRLGGEAPPLLRFDALRLSFDFQKQMRAPLNAAQLGRADEPALLEAYCKDIVAVRRPQGGGVGGAAAVLVMPAPGFDPLIYVRTIIHSFFISSMRMNVHGR
jgi:hypothetical protein